MPIIRGKVLRSLQCFAIFAIHFKNMKYLPSQKRIGVLGAGQLGRMLAQAGSRLDIGLAFLDQSDRFPAAKLAGSFTVGDFKDPEKVLAFGLEQDIITIEIENVAIDALEELERRGKKVYPQPSVLNIAVDKGAQKMFYQAKGFPSSPFKLFNSPQDIIEMWRMGVVKLPFVQKLRRGGYDGKGVFIVRKESDLNHLLEGPSLIENAADIEREISVIAVRSVAGEIRCYPAVSMEFHPTANLVEFLMCPAQLPHEVEMQAQQLAMDLAEELKIVGLLAVEMFYNKNGKLWINEIAPRPHNSGHHTIDNGAVSQFENHLRAICGWPLGTTQGRVNAIMVNLLGEVGFEGPVSYEGVEECLALEGVHIHLYGKEICKPFRKMGHITICDENLDACKEKATFVKNTLKAKS